MNLLIPCVKVKNFCKTFDLILWNNIVCKIMYICFVYIPFCSRDAVIWLKAKSFFVFLLCLKRCAAVNVIREVDAA